MDDMVFTEQINKWKLLSEFFLWAFSFSVGFDALNPPGIYSGNLLRRDLGASLAPTVGVSLTPNLCTSFGLDKNKIVYFLIYKI